jgi:hypothetical protein
MFCKIELGFLDDLFALVFRHLRFMDDIQPVSGILQGIVQ